MSRPRTAVLEPRFVVKVCGVRDQEDVDVSVDAGATALGFNFYPKSPRFIDSQQAGKLQTPAGCLRVGVFVNPTAQELHATIVRAHLDVVQVHGSTPVVSPEVRFWKSIPADSALHSGETEAEAYLIDTPTPEFGGSGETFDWSLARSFPHRVILAGGLDATNVAEAVAAVAPWGVDACSRLESAPGKKDAARVRNFVSAALAASKQLLSQEFSL